MLWHPWIWFLRESRSSDLHFGNSRSGSESWMIRIRGKFCFLSTRFVYIRTTRIWIHVFWSGSGPVFGQVGTGDTSPVIRLGGSVSCKWNLVGQDSFQCGGSVWIPIHNTWDLHQNRVALGYSSTFFLFSGKNCITTLIILFRGSV